MTSPLKLRPMSEAKPREDIIVFDIHGALHAGWIVESDGGLPMLMTRDNGKPATDYTGFVYPDELWNSIDKGDLVETHPHHLAHQKYQAWLRDGDQGKDR